MDRRGFLTSASALLAGGVAQAAPSAPAEFIDTNVSLGQWPVRHTPYGTATSLLKKLRQHGVTSGWTGSFDGVLNSDVASVNARLAEACQRDGAGVLIPFGAINPTLPDWEDDLRRCHEVHRMPGVRLWPSYHGYTLDHERFARLIDLATRRGLLVQIAVTIEDDRSQNPALLTAPVVLAPLADVMQKFPGARVMVLNATTRLLSPSNALLRRLAGAGVLAEIATLEGVAGIERLLATIPGLRLAFGSHAPFQYFESALLKLDESALDAAQLQSIRAGVARAALAPR